MGQIAKLPVFILIFFTSLFGNLFSAIQQEDPIVEQYFKTAQEFLEKKNFDSALIHYEKGLQLLLAEGMITKYINESNTIGKTFLDFNKLGEAKKILINANQHIRTKHSNDTAALIQHLNNLGELFHRQQVFDSAFYVTQKRLSLIKHFSEKEEITLAWAYYNLSVLSRNFKDVGVALQYADSAEIFEVSDQNFNSVLLSSKARIYEQMGKFEKAIDYYERYLNIKVKISGHESPQAALGNLYLGSSYAARNKDDQDNRTAIDFFQKGWNILILINPDHYYSPYFHYGLAQSYKNLSEFEKALDHLTEAKKLNVKLYGENFPEKGYVHQFFGGIYVANKNLKEAEVELLAAIKYYDDYYGPNYNETAKCLIYLGDLYVEKLDFNKALKYYHQVIQYLTPEFESGDLLATPQVDILKPNTYLLEALLAKAKTLAKLKNEGNRYLESALISYTTASEYINLAKQGFYLTESEMGLEEKHSDFYEEGIETALQLFVATNDQNYIAKALQLADARKASMLLSNLKNVNARTFASIPDSLLEKEKFIKNQLASVSQQYYLAKNDDTDSTDLGVLNAQMFSLKVDLDKLKKHFEEGYPSYHQLKYDVTKANWINLDKKVFAEREFVIEYFLGKSKIYAFLYGNEYIDYLEMPFYSDLELDVNMLLKSLKGRNPGDFSKTAFHLYNELVNPVLQKFAIKNQKPNHLVIIPDGLLGYIPFEALIQTSPLEKQGYKDLDYLIKNYQISYHYSASLLTHNFKEKQKKDRPPFLGFAPTFIDKASSQYLALNERTRSFMDTLTALPDAEKEVNAIAKLLNGQAQIGIAATEYNFKQMAGKYKILHLASHSIIEDEDPLYSRLLFDNEQDSIDDGFLHTYELYNMDLNADLVTLSACNTGVGKLYKGEGIMSLARGFMYAGVPNLVMSLWSVSDKPTKDLMTFFYQELKNGEPKSAALRNAKLRYLQQADNVTADPYYWGSFIYLGQVEPTKSSLSPGIWSSIVGLLASLALLMVWQQNRSKTTKAA